MLFLSPKSKFIFFSKFSWLFRDMIVSVIYLKKSVKLLQQDNARPCFPCIVRIFFDAENIRQLSLSARSPDLSLIKNPLSIVSTRLARWKTPMNTMHELQHFVETTWTVCWNYMNADTWHSVFSDSLSRHITALIAAENSCLSIDLSGTMILNLLKISMNYYFKHNAHIQ